MNFFRSRSSKPTCSLIAFYENSSPDSRGRYLPEILSYSANKLELDHDYIQILFPLPEESGLVWDAPIIDRNVFDAFRSRKDLRDNLFKSFERMLWFYGFKPNFSDGKLKIVKGDNYEEHSGIWDTRFDHNHLRITRIIRSLRVSGLEEEALAFRDALEESATRVSSRSREFWRRAAERALNIRPDLDIEDERDFTIGPKFLREFEEKRREEARSETKGGFVSQTEAVRDEDINKQSAAADEEYISGEPTNDTEEEPKSEGVDEDCSNGSNCKKAATLVDSKYLASERI